LRFVPRHPYPLDVEYRRPGRNERDSSSRIVDRECGAHAAIGHALGGQPGARLAAILAMPVSPDMLLWRVRLNAAGTAPVPLALGVDDFAFRKGSRYGTILLDLQRRRVIALLPGREAATVAAWLGARPGVEVVSRNSTTAYAQAAGEAVPYAVQVADRWRLMKNAREITERVLRRRAASVLSLLGGRRGEPATDGPWGGPVPPEETPREEFYSPKREVGPPRFTVLASPVGAASGPITTPVALR
jgi:transposase